MFSFSQIKKYLLNIMDNIQEQVSKTILTKAYKELHDNPISNIGCTIGLRNEDDIYTWKCSLMGPKDSPYKNGLFKLLIKFPKTFPMEGPEVLFETPIYHLNVNHVKTEESLGHCCISTANFWTPDSSIHDLLVSIFALFLEANPDSAYGIDRKIEFEKDRNTYDMKARYFTKKYAIAGKSYKNLNNWDFTMNE